MRIALAFSGGKDSWACLHLNAHRLQEIAVIWVNAGKNFPEAEEMVAKARAMCPNFYEVHSDREGQNQREGLPSDVVPIDHTPLGMLMTGQKSVKVQSYLECCNANISQPLMAKCKELGITELIRGQRLDEAHKSPARDGDVYFGIVFRQPIEHWTTEQVLSYLTKRMEIPEHFGLAHSSLDCYDCTAYAKETGDRIIWAARHPVLAAKYEARRTLLLSAIKPYVNALSEKDTHGTTQ